MYHGLTDVHLWRLQSVQNAGAQLVIKTHHPVLRDLRWLPL